MQNFENRLIFQKAFKALKKGMDKADFIEEMKKLYNKENVSSLYGLLPNPTPRLIQNKTQDQAYAEIKPVHQVLTGFISRRNKTMGMEWKIDQSEADNKVFNDIKSWFEDFEVEDLMSFLVNVPYYGRQHIVLNWNTSGSIWYIDEMMDLPLDMVTWEDNAWKVYNDAEPAGITPEIPELMLNLMHINNIREFGEPLFSSCFWDAMYIKHGKQFYAKFVEKYGYPWVFATADIRELGATRGNNGAMSDEDITKVLKFVTEAIELGLQDNIIVTEKGMDVKPMEPGKASNATIFEGHIKKSEEAISKILLGHASAMDSVSNKLGSESTADGIRDDYVKSDQRIVEKGINKVIEYFCNLNYGPKIARPKFILYEEDDIAILDKKAELFNKLFTVGVRLKKEAYVREFPILNDDDFDLEHVSIETEDEPEQDVEDEVTTETPDEGDEETEESEKKNLNSSIYASLPEFFAKDADDVGSDQKTIDKFIEWLQDQNLEQKVIDKILDQIENFADKSDSLNKMLSDYADLYKDFDTADLFNMILGALVVSTIFGIHSLQKSAGSKAKINFNDLIVAFRKSPEKAEEYLKNKGVKLSPSWKETLKIINKKAFTVSGVTKIDILNDFKDEIQKGIAEQKDRKEFAKEIKEKLQKKGWINTKITTAHRLNLIYDTNVQSAFMDGRWSEVETMASSRPYLMMLSTLDKKTTKECKFLHNKYFKFDDPKLHTIMPMGHFGCRRNYITLTESNFKKRGGKVTKASTIQQYKNAKGFIKKLNEVYKHDMSKYPKELQKVYDGD